MSELTDEISDAIRGMVGVNAELDELRRRCGEGSWTSEDLDRYLRLAREEAACHRRYLAACRRYDAVRQRLREVEDGFGRLRGA